MKNLTSLFILFLGISASAQSWRTLQFDKTTNQVNYNDLYFHSESNGHLVGNNWSYLQTFDKGRTWSVKDISSLKDSVFSRVIFLNDSVGFLQGESFLYKTLNGGNSWSTINLGWYRNQIGITDGQVFAYGDSGFGGLYFSRYYPDQDSFDFQQGVWSVYDLEKLYYIGDSVIIMAKDSGTIYRSTDLGKTFDKVYALKNNDVNYGGVNDIMFTNKDTGMLSINANGEKLFTTTDGGKTWNPDKNVFLYSGISRFQMHNGKVHLINYYNSAFGSEIVVYWFDKLKLTMDTSFYTNDIPNGNFIGSNGKSLYTGLGITATTGVAAIYYKSLSSLHTTELNRLNLKIYPNPSNGRFKLELQSMDTRNLKIEVMNSLGQKETFESNLSANLLEMSIQQPGVHFLQLSQKGILIYSGKLLVE